MLILKDLFPIPEPLPGRDLPAGLPDTAPAFGAATAAHRFGRRLGNGAESERWFGRRPVDPGADEPLRHCA